MKLPAVLLALSFLPVVSAQEAGLGNQGDTAPQQATTLNIGGFRYGTYKVTSLDRIQVTLFGEPELAVSEIVDRYGMIHLKLVGEINIAGLTVNDAEEKIEREYVNQRYLRRPKARIKIVDYAPQEVLMLGTVARPGPFKFPPEVEAMDIVEAVARSGGTTGIARTTKVTIKRKTDTGFDVYQVNLKELQKGLEEGNDEGRFFLLPGDIVFIPERII